jgi:hypothetical protein
MPPLLFMCSSLPPVSSSLASRGLMWRIVKKCKNRLCRDVDNNCVITAQGDNICHKC